MQTGFRYLLDKFKSTLEDKISFISTTCRVRVHLQSLWNKLIDGNIILSTVDKCHRKHITYE